MAPKDDEFVTPQIPDDHGEREDRIAERREEQRREQEQLEEEFPAEEK